MPDRVLIITSKFNEFITKALLSGAQESLNEAGISNNNQQIIWVPGCFELPVVAAQAARSKKFNAIICLGAIIRGETPHFDYVAQSTASGLMQASVETHVPIIFGVLTTDNQEQALARCGIKGGNKGSEAATTAIKMIKVMRDLEERIQF